MGRWASLAQGAGCEPGHTGRAQDYQRPIFCSAQKRAARFLHEARLAARLRHRTSPVYFTSARATLRLLQNDEPMGMSAKVDAGDCFMRWSSSKGIAPRRACDATGRFSLASRLRLPPQVGRARPLPRNAAWFIGT